MRKEFATWLLDERGRRDSRHVVGSDARPRRDAEFRRAFDQEIPERGGEAAEYRHFEHRPTLRAIIQAPQRRTDITSARHRDRAWLERAIVQVDRQHLA